MSDHELPDVGVRNRSGHSRVIHELDEAADVDDPEPACDERNRPGARFKDVDPATRLRFDGFTLCRRPGCWSELDVDAIEASLADDHHDEQRELVADGGTEPISGSSSTIEDVATHHNPDADAPVIDVCSSCGVQRPVAPNGRCLACNAQERRAIHDPGSGGDTGGSP